MIVHSFDNFYKPHIEPVASTSWLRWHVCNLGEEGGDRRLFNSSLVTADKGTPNVPR